MRLFNITSTLFTISCVAFTACKKKDSFDAPVPVIYKISPATGRFGTQVTIIGRYFNANKANEVQFNGVKADIINKTDSTITVIVPKGSGHGEVALTYNSTIIKGPVFNYEYTVTVSTVAGPTNEEPGYKNGTGAEVRFKGLWDIAIDNEDNLYIVDHSNFCIRKMDAAGTVSLFAGIPGQKGNDNGPVASAKFSSPAGICVNQNKDVFVTDVSSNLIRKISAGMVSTYAGNGTRGNKDHTDPLQATFTFNGYCASDADGNIFATSAGSVRKIGTGGGVTTIAGNANEGGFKDGQGSESRFNNPFDLAINSQKEIFVVDNYNSRIRKISSTNYVSTIAGNGLRSSVDAANALHAGFYQPYFITIDKKSNLLVGEMQTGFIRMITTDGRVITLTKGGRGSIKDGDGNMAKFGLILGMAVNSRNELFVADGGYCIRKVIFE
jgi:hypothetical protein